MKLPDSPDNIARGNRNGHAEAKKAATTRLHRTRGNTQKPASLHKNMKTQNEKHIGSHAGNETHRIQGAQDGYCPGCKDAATPGRVHHDIAETDMQQDTTRSSSTASCKVAPLDHGRHTHKPGSIQVCFVDAALKDVAPTQQSVPRSTASKESPIGGQQPPAKENIATDKETHPQQDKIDSEHCISLDTMGKAQ